MEELKHKFELLEKERQDDKKEAKQIMETLGELIANKHGMAEAGKSLMMSGVDDYYDMEAQNNEGAGIAYLRQLL